MLPHHLQSSFRGTGLVPFNPNEVKPSKTAPSLAMAGTSSSPHVNATLTVHLETLNFEGTSERS